MLPKVEIEIEGMRATWWFFVAVTYLGNERTMDDPGSGPDWEVLEDTLSCQALVNSTPCTVAGLVEDIGGQDKFDEAVTKQVVDALLRDDDNDDRWYSQGGYRF